MARAQLGGDGVTQSEKDTERERKQREHREIERGRESRAVHSGCAW